MDTGNANLGSDGMGERPLGVADGELAPEVAPSPLGVRSGVWATRHRYTVRANSLVCGQAWGGVVRCALPYDNAAHYHDEDHPYAEGQGILARRCVWRLQVGERRGEPCGWVRGWVGHSDSAWFEGAGPVLDGNTRTGTFELSDEAVVASLTSALRPPDEDAEARSAPSPFVDADDELSAEAPWRAAVAALMGNDAEVTGGPWPVRLLRLHDWDADDNCEPVLEFLRGLVRLGEVWSMTASRSGSSRWVMLSWGRYVGLSVSEICDEMAVEYDEP